MRTGRVAASAAAGVLLCAGLAGCGTDPALTGATDQAAKALSSGSFNAPVFAEPTKVKQAYDGAVGGLGPIHPRVVVTDTSTDGSRATATLHWSWPIGTGHWTYTTRMTLQQTGGAWHALWAPDVAVPHGRPGDRVYQERTPSRRGRILGAGGAVLVKPRPVVKVGIDKSRLKTATVAPAARELASLAGVRVKPYVDEVKASGPKAFVPAITFRRNDVPPAVAHNRIKGVVMIPGSLPLAPTKQFAAPLLGTVGPATGDIVAKSHGRVLPGDTVGLSGLELRYDRQLGGTPGARVVLLPAKGKSRTLYRTAPVAGHDLRMTLSPRLQSLAEKVLAHTGPASALVAIQPSTGHVLAAASGPGSKGYDTATFGRYAPGSTFKLVSSLALLRSGLTPHSRVPCTTSIDVEGKTFTNDSEYPPGGTGNIPLTLALANSCNTAYISQHTRLHGADLADAAAALGFGVDHDTGFPSFFGQVPAKPASLVTAAADMIGQGQVLASPFAMATVVASIKAGHAVVPSLLPQVKTAAAKPQHPLTKREDRELTQMMRAVVTTPTGTGHGLAGVPGPPVTAKTGTAEFGSTPPLDTHAWMVAGQGDLAVAAFVDRGHTGAGVAGPLLEAFLRGAHTKS